MASTAYAGAIGLEQSADPDDPKSVHIAYALAMISVVAIRRALGDAAYLELKRMFDERADAEQAWQPE